MSGPFGVTLTVISGQKFSREIVVAASTFLSMGYLSIIPMGNHGKIRPEFLTALDIFCNREDLYYQENATYFAEGVAEPGTDLSRRGLFVLALDKEGEALAQSSFESNGELPNERVHRSAHRLNLIEGTITPPPQVEIPLQVWAQSRRQHFAHSVRYHKLKPGESYYAYMNAQLPLTPEETLYYAWCEALYEALIPWQDIIRNIQSDYS